MTYAGQRNMIPSWRRRGNAMGGAPFRYANKVLNTASDNLIAYWQLGEASGINAVNADGIAARDATYSSDVAGWPIGAGIGDGNTAPLFDGTNDFINAYTPTFDFAFNGKEFSILIWMRVANAGIWSDASFRRLIEFEVNANNKIRINTHGVTANRMQSIYSAGGVHLTKNVDGLVSLDNLVWLVTVSATDDEFITYLNGVAQGAAVGGLGAWAGGLAPAGTLIGAETTVPTNLWEGMAAHVAVWSGYPGGILTPAQALELATL